MMTAGNRGVRGSVVGLLVVSLGSCTAARVVTHTTDTNPVEAPAGHYRLDPHHWSVLFDVDHLHYTRFVMRFDKVSASLDFASQRPEDSHVDVVIDAASVDTNDPELDRLITGAEMFDAAHYPDIRFVSTSLTRSGPDTGQMAGTLTMRGRSIPIDLLVTFNGGAPNPVSRQYTLGFAATGSFDRSRLGLSTWFPAVGNRVNVAIQAEFVKDE